MSDKEPATVVGAVSRLGDHMLTALPPAFVVLCALNCVFIGTVLWFLNSQMTVRTAIVSKVLDTCLEMQTERHRAD